MMLLKLCQGRHDDAIAGYHRALGLKPDDPFAAEMLKKALQVGAMVVRSVPLFRFVLS